MDKGIEIVFFPVQCYGPYIQNLLEYECDGKEGHITFNGYYYVDDLPSDEHSRSLPQTTIMRMTRYSTFPEDTETWFTRETMLGCLTDVKHTKTKKLEQHEYEVEIYKRTKHENTSKISTIPDEDGSAMDVCFFPTHTQTLYFKVLKQKTYVSLEPEYRKQSSIKIEV